MKIAGPVGIRPPRAAALLISALLLLGCGGGTRLSVTSAGQERWATLEHPARPAGPRPLLVVLHAATLSGAEARFALAPRGPEREAPVTLVFPDAGGLVWNEGSFARAVPGAMGSADDLGFLDALIARLVADGTADPARIHIAGISNGGMMALHYACRRAGRIASVTAFMATMPPDAARSCRPDRPLDVLLVAGTEDRVTTWDGRVVMAGVATLQQRLSVPDSFAFWRGANGCTGLAPPTALPRRGRGGDPHVVVHAARGCAGDVRTLLYEVRGGGHRLPGDMAWPVLWPLGEATPDIEAREILLRFVRGAGRTS